MKVPLNVNKQAEGFLKTAERVPAMDELKNSNIKFDQDEMGSAVPKAEADMRKTGESFHKGPPGAAEYMRELSVF